MYSDYKVAVIGDVMLDIWVRGEVARLSPEAPVPVILNPTTEHSLGGAGNVAANIVSLGAKAHLYSIVPDPDFFFEELCGMAGIIFRCECYAGRPATEKKRMVANGQQVCRVDTEDITLVDDFYTKCLMDELGQAIVKDIAQNVSPYIAYDAFIIADYNKGVMTPPFIGSVMDLARGHDIPVMVDPKFRNWFAYNGATILKPNWSEWKTFIADNSDDELEVENLVITKGAGGMQVHPRGHFSGHGFDYIEAHPVSVADTTGAGDTVMAVLTLEYLRTGDIFKSAELANYAGALAVQHQGTYQVTVEDLASSPDWELANIDWNKEVE